ncbi:DsbA family protein [Jannaschia sp. Os4]|uniref:DsbA family protein n=1 Tax=Jannaschia sp. Os4 TaxID=2807617 RepID=UPI00193A79E0|nr:DsbA family protein [Jannaschia sp. Os4]MBM2575312.1 DsbA family protein [Jannaschia sp. Os4]
MPTRRDALLLIPAGLAAAGSYAWLNRGGDALPTLDVVGAANAQAADVAEMTLGDPDAPVKVIEYASFTCPHCADFHRDTFKDFREQFIDTGRVHFTYREVYFDRYGLWASMIARCAGPDRFFGVADLLYQQQSRWAREADAADVAASIKRIGAQAGLDAETADACLTDAAQAEALVAWYQANAQSDGIRSTPSFLINGDMHAGNMGIAQLGRLVEEAGA